MAAARPVAWPRLLRAGDLVLDHRQGAGSADDSGRVNKIVEQALRLVRLWAQQMDMGTGSAARPPLTHPLPRRAAQAPFRLLTKEPSLPHGQGEAGTKPG